MEKLKKVGSIFIRFLILILMFFASAFVLEKFHILTWLIDRLGNLYICIPVFLTYFLFRDYKRYSLGLKAQGGLGDFFLGALIGIISISLVFVFDILLKRVEVASINNLLASRNFYSYLLLMLGVGLGEEVLSRGYMQNMLWHFTDKYLAVFVPAIIFASLHFFNPGALNNPLPAINLFLISIVFAMLTIYKSLWAAIGYHFTWNFFQGGVFGMNVSGTGLVQSVFTINVLKDDLVYGGEFGPEGGLLVTVLCVLTIMVLYRAYNKKSR